jgi:D-glycero-D-manno-heptose 1,7-bisphosphate phosphatase
MKKIKLLILDRDGVINLDSDNYIRCPDDFIPIESSLRAIAMCNQAQIPVVIATNQSGVGRGYFSIETLNAIHDKMHAALKSQGAYIDGIYVCPHRPDAGCDCRKPSPGLLQSISADYPKEFAYCVMVGDSWSDWQVAKAMGITPYLVRTGKGERTLAKYENDIPPNHVFADLAAVVKEVFHL